MELGKNSNGFTDNEEGNINTHNKRELMESGGCSSCIKATIGCLRRNRLTAILPPRCSVEVENCDMWVELSKNKTDKKKAIFKTTNQGELMESGKCFNCKNTNGCAKRDKLVGYAYRDGCSIEIKNCREWEELVEKIDLHAQRDSEGNISVLLPPEGSLSSCAPGDFSARKTIKSPDKIINEIQRIRDEIVLLGGNLKKKTIRASVFQMLDNLKSALHDVDILE